MTIRNRVSRAATGGNSIKPSRRTASVTGPDLWSYPGGPRRKGFDHLRFRGRANLTEQVAPFGLPIPTNQLTFIQMSQISSPYVSLDDPDRPIRCQDALNASVQELVAKATAAGWSNKETLIAIIEIADNHLLSLATNDDAEILIALLKRMT